MLRRDILIQYEEIVYGSWICYDVAVYLPRGDPYRIIAETIRIFKSTGEPYIEGGYNFPLEDCPRSMYMIRVIKRNEPLGLTILLFHESLKLLQIKYDNESGSIEGKPEELVEKVEEWLEY